LPAVHVPPVVHPRLSSHAVPFAAVVPTHAPFEHASAVVHELPSSHDVPAAAGV
jgi:hypothetical protein